MGRSGAVARIGLTTLLVVALDQAAKAIVRGGIDAGQARRVIGGTLTVVHAENDGVAFGGFAGNATVVGLLVAAVMIGLLVYVGTHLQTPFIWLPTGMILGGAIGNAIDRIRTGTVTDFIKLPHWPAFNLADIAISVGVVGLLIVVELDARRRERRRNDGGTEKADDGAPGPA